MPYDWVKKHLSGIVFVVIVIPASSFRKCLQALATRVDSLPDSKSLSKATRLPSTQQGEIIADGLNRLGLTASPHVIQGHVFVALTETADNKVASNVPDGETASTILESQTLVLKSVSLLRVVSVKADPKRVRGAFDRLVNNNQKGARSDQAHMVKAELGRLDPNNATHMAIKDAIDACVVDDILESRKGRVSQLYSDHGKTITELTNRQSTLEGAVFTISSFNAQEL